MKMKSEVIAILVAEKEKETAAVAIKFDALIAQVDALTEAPAGDEVESLRLQLAEEKAKTEAVQAAFDADEIEDAATQASLEEQVAAKQAKLDAIKAALEA
jgi:hypothetical protein